MKKLLYTSILALSACAVGPDYAKPEVQTPEQFKEALGWKKAEPQDNFKRNNWWEAFGDKDLNALEEQVNISNQNIKVAEAQYRQAQALVAQAQSAFFPTVSFGASDTRFGTGTGAHNSSGSTFNGIGNTHDASLTASWEPDIWGKIRRQVESTEATAEANAADVESAKLSAQATLASDYLQLRVDDAQKRLLDRTVIDYQKSLQLTLNQYNAGIAARADVVQAQTQLETTQAQDMNIGVQRAQFEHAIAVLIGKPPAELTIAPVDFVPPVPDIPVSVPSKILERRPDIAATERSVAAANAQIGVAEAAFYPDLTLSASGGFDSAYFAKWFSLPNRIWSIGPNVAETIFDAGLRSAQTDQAIAVYDQTVATYRQTVLGGFQEVEDNLAALRIYEQEAKTQHDAVVSSQKAVEITLNQYKAGTVNYLTVIVAQATALTNEQAELTVEGERLVAAVTLIKALGGGWNAPAEKAPALPDIGAAKTETDDELCSVDHLNEKQFLMMGAVTPVSK